MKTNLYLAMLMAASTMTLTTACDDDEEVSLAEQVANSYTGWSVGNCTYFQDYGATDAETVVVSKVGETGVEVSYDSQSFGTFVTTEATVSEANGKKSIVGTGKVSMAGMSGVAKEYDFTLSAELGKPYVFNFTIPAVMGGLTLTVTEGQLPAVYGLIGTYTGWSVSNSQYFKNYNPTEGEKVSVARVSETEVKVTYTSATFGSFVVTNATFEGSKISGSGKVSMAGMSGEAKEYDFTLEAEVGDASTFTFTIPAVMGGLAITVTKGDMPEELKVKE